MHGDVDEMLVDVVLFAGGVRSVASHRSCVRLCAVPSLLMRDGMASSNKDSLLMRSSNY